MAKLESHTTEKLDENFSELSSQRWICSLADRDIDDIDDDPSHSGHKVNPTGQQTTASG